MNKAILKIMVIAFIFCIVFPVTSNARDGGFDTGILAQKTIQKSKTAIDYDYKEVCFLSGEPVILKGDLNISKTMKGDSINTTFKYNLWNYDVGAKLTRIIVYTTAISKKDNGQTVEVTTLSTKPVEAIIIGDTTYVLSNMDFSRTCILDPKPAINYYAGNTSSLKVYAIGTGTTTALATGTVTVSAIGDFYGYDQYWSSVLSGNTKYTIQSTRKIGEQSDEWGGQADVDVTITDSKDLRFVYNSPEQISFEGGFVQTNTNISNENYNCRLPEFDDYFEMATDNVKDYSDNLSLETFPSQSRLLVPTMNNLRGHWAEKDIKTLYSLEILRGLASDYDPEQFMTRIEFTEAMVNAAKEVPKDTALASKASSRITSARTKKQQEVSPFTDVSTSDSFFKYVDEAYKRGLIDGRGEAQFGPYEPLTVADAITMFVRSIGLDNLAPGDMGVTGFKDNDDIPEYARSAVYVAERIGLIRGDDDGYLGPMDQLTKARAAAMINRFVEYMREGIKKEYRERINY